jgi:uncharacterized repeat protein (TIGR02543 family)
VLKRGIARAITLFASLFIFASSLGVASPAKAATYDGVSGTIQTAPTSTRASYTLTGWSTTSGNSQDIITFPYAPTATTNITLFAIWSAKTNTVTYNAGAGTAVESDSFTTGGTIQTAPTSTRPGYTLLGWSTSENGSVIEFPYTPTATYDITLHAIWSANTGTVNYNSTGGSSVDPD